MWDLRNKTNVQRERNQETDSFIENTLVVTGGGVGEGNGQKRGWG